MSTTTHEIVRDQCTGCGACAAVCPARIFTMEAVDGTSVAAPIKERTLFCIECGHCMAVCPTRAVLAPGLEYDRDLYDLPRSAVGADDLTAFLAARRSVRSYRPDPVDHEKLDQIVSLISLAPMGHPPHKVALTVIDNRETIERLLPLLAATYERLAKMTQTPVGRFILRRKLPANKYRSLSEHVLPTMGYRLREMHESGGDTFTRGAPAMILFHTTEDSDIADNDAGIALTYGLLAAHSLGLGATAIDLIGPVLNRVAEARRIARIPEHNVVKATMILGHPRHRYLRGIRRNLAGVTWGSGADGPGNHHH